MWPQASEVSASSEMWWPDLCPPGRGAWLLGCSEEQQCGAVWVSPLPSQSGFGELWSQPGVFLPLAWPALVNQCSEGRSEHGTHAGCRREHENLKRINREAYEASVGSKSCFISFVIFFLVVFSYWKGFHDFQIKFYTVNVSLYF